MSLPYRAFRIVKQFNHSKFMVANIVELLNKALSDNDKALLKGLSEPQKQKILQWLEDSKNAKANILVTGATGCGKSSTINALFGTEEAKVGTGTDPETMDIQKYDLGNLILWDSPGLGDSPDADKRHADGIIKKLEERDSNNELLIDVVLVILDGSVRDMGTSYDLITQVIVPHLGENPEQREKRLLIGINQADMAMKGRNWDSENHKPNAELGLFLAEKERSVRQRIKDGCGLSVEPISYAAGFKEEGKPQEPSYNISKLLYYIVDSIPSKKRLAVVSNRNTDEQRYKYDDGEKNYNDEVTKKTATDVVGDIAGGAAIGAALGSVIPGVGTVIGGAIGGVCGFLKSLFW